MGYPLYQLNNPKGYKTFGISKKKITVLFSKTNHRFGVSTYFFQIFYSKFIFLAYLYFTSANRTIYNIGYLEQTGKKCSIFVKSYFTFFFIFFEKKKTCKKMELNEKKN